MDKRPALFFTKTGNKHAENTDEEFTDWEMAVRVQNPNH